METIKNIGTDFFNWINPIEVDFGSAGHIAVYVLKVLLILVILYTLFSAIKNRKAIIRFFRASIEELRKIDWLNGKDLRQFSMICIILMTLTTLIVLGLDQG